MKLALSILCENPRRKTGLTTLFHEFVTHSLRLFPDVEWIVFAGPQQEWAVNDPRVNVVRRFPANDDLKGRLFADHFRVPALARQMRADALLTVGFLPIRRCLPVIMHLFSLQHVNVANRVGRLRALYRGLAVDRGLAKADLIVTNSQWAASQILAHHPDCRDRLAVSYEGLQHEQFTPKAAPGEIEGLRTRFGLEPGYLLWVSNFYPYKQADRLLAAYARLDPARRRPLAMVGGNWEGGLDDARRIAERLGVASTVRFYDWVEDQWLAPLYRQARAFCLASREETFGRCVVEAMACGTPCVVNAIPIMREVTGGHAVLIDFDDAAASAAALASLNDDDALHARLREAGIAWAAQFDFAKLARERIERIRAALSRNWVAHASLAAHAFSRPAMKTLVSPVRALVLWGARLLGSEIIDQRTGQPLGRAMILSWRGKVYVIGLDEIVTPVFAPQDRLTYWKQEIGFSTHPEPDFPNEARP